MNIFPTTWPSKPVGYGPISAATRAYFRARNQYRVHSLILDEFARSGLTQAQLARRCGKRPEVVSRILGEPGNWTLNTLSDLLFALCGGEPVYSVGHPLDAAPRNQAVSSDGVLETGISSETESGKTAQLEFAA